MVVTLGKKGALISGFSPKNIPVPEVISIDATGAGDAFNGALAVALARGQEIEDAVRFANAVAALSTTRMGAQQALPTAEEVNDFIEASNHYWTC
jgi:ribokinase